MSAPIEKIIKNNIVEKDLSTIDIMNQINLNNDIISKNIMEGENIIPTKLIQTCKGFSCICWKKGIKDFCIDYRYKSCLKCYNDNCIRMIEGHQKVCNKKEF